MALQPATVHLKNYPVKDAEHDPGRSPASTSCPKKARNLKRIIRNKGVGGGSRGIQASMDSKP